MEERNYKAAALVAVRRNGYALEDVGSELKNDKDVVLAAVSENGGALQFASPELKNDKDVVLHPKPLELFVLKSSGTSISQKPTLKIDFLADKYL